MWENPGGGGWVGLGVMRNILCVAITRICRLRQISIMWTLWGFQKHFCCDYTIALPLYPCHLYFIKSNKFKQLEQFSIWSAATRASFLLCLHLEPGSERSNENRGDDESEEGEGEEDAEEVGLQMVGRGDLLLAGTTALNTFPPLMFYIADCAYSLCLYVILLCHLVGLSTCWIVGLCWPCIDACIQLHMVPFYWVEFLYL